MSRSPRTPQIAEALFESACFAAGLSPNRSYDDQFGWDYLVQFPSLRQDGPADLDPPGASCLAQVKSKRNGPPACRVKLSNALRFAQEDLPCFLVLLIFQNDESIPTATYVRHVWTDDIAAALKAARQAHGDKETALHRRTLTIRFAPEERCELADLPQRMEHALATMGGGYAAQKSALAASVGYEDGFATGKFTFDPSVDDEAFVDLMLGRIPDLPVSEISMIEHRFGMPGPELIPNKPGRLSVSATPIESCQVIVAPVDGDGELTLDGDLYIPGVPGLPKELFKFRVQTSVLEILVRPSGRSELNLSYDSDAPLEISVLADLARLWSWASRGELDVALWIGSSRLLHARITLDPSATRVPWRRLAVALARLLDFAPARRWPGDARLTLRDLVAGLEVIETFVGQVARPGVRIGLGSVNPKFAEMAARCRRYLAPAYLDFGGTTLFAVIEAPINEIQVEPDQGSILLGNPRVLRRAVLKGDATANLALLQEQFREARAERGGGGDVLIGSLGDIEVEVALVQPGLP